MGGRRGAGFTLIELMIVIAIIAVIAAIAIPNLLSAKTNANQTSAMATLRNLVSAQAQLAVGGRIDADKDGKGEYGTFLEMSGAVGVRKAYTQGAPGITDFSLKGEALNPPCLSSVFASVSAAGFTTKSGYALIIFLPDSAGTAGFVHETGPAASAGFAGGTGSVGVDHAEVSWCAYAQPMQYGGTGTRRFFTNQKGDIMASQNDGVKAQGAATIVANSAFVGTGITASVAVGTRGNDGEVWTVAN
jgi:prepilin-type N-terminal cleavage/methylation domain-containing protein